MFDYKILTHTHTHTDTHNDEKKIDGWIDELDFYDGRGLITST